MQNKPRTENSIDLLIVDLLNGEITPDGFLELSKWLQADDQHIKKFNLARIAWIASGKRVIVTEDRINEALTGIKSALGSGKDRQVRKTFRSFGKIAASWIVFVAIGALLNHFISQKDDDNLVALNETVITSPIGSRSIIDLPDGSKVFLNAGSTLTYSKDFGKQYRAVSLNGEAYFNVITNNAVPFLVRTGEVTVKALGTKFNVKAYPDEEVITTTLEEGIIEVTSGHNKASGGKVTLKPNQMYTYFRKPSKEKVKDNAGSEYHPGKAMKVLSNINTEPLTSWKNKTWIIEAQPLGTLAPILERRYNIQISFDSDEISQFKFTSKIEDETIEQIMNALELTAPVKYSLEKNHLHLMIDKDRINRYRQNTNP